MACFICQNPNHEAKQTADGAFECVFCGTYEIDGLRLGAVLGNPANADSRLRMGLAAHTRQANTQGQIPIYTLDNYAALGRQHLHTSIQQKFHLMLSALANRTRHPGALVKFDSHKDFPLLDAAASDEADYFLDALCQRGEVEEFEGDLYRITPQGWARLEPLGMAGVPGTCFVAMSFQSDLNGAYDAGIYPAVADDCGFEIIRVDRVEHVENINDKIMADLRRAQFVVADFTRHPNGVYFEAGFALGLGRLVIWTCHKDDFKEAVHFDTRPYNHILWSDPAELRDRLAARIRGLLLTPKP
jgi:hypothetical protein